jgi:hypothetical protein
MNSQISSDLDYKKENNKNKQEVLGKLIARFPSMQHGPHRKAKNWEGSHR